MGTLIIPTATRELIKMVKLKCYPAKCHWNIKSSVSSEMKKTCFYFVMAAILKSKKTIFAKTILQIFVTITFN